MRKITLLLTCLLFAQLAAMANFESGTKLYLKPNSNWMEADARFAAYFYDNSNNTTTWADMTLTSGETNIYEVIVPGSYPKVIFCRMNPNNTANNWDNKWDQTQDLSPVAGKNCFVIQDGSWSSGEIIWTTYTPPTTLYIVGPAVNNDTWENLGIEQMTSSTKNIFTWTGTLYNNKEFKFRQHENDWDGVQYATGSNVQPGTYVMNSNLTDRNGNCTWTGAEGKYNVTVNITNSTLNITPAELYIAGASLDNWNKHVKMESTDGTTYTWHGKLSGEFKFFTDATSENGQLGAAATENLSISIGTIYNLAYTSGNAMKTFILKDPISCTVRVNVKTKQIRILPEDIYIAGSSTVPQIGQGEEWNTSDVQGCVRDKENGTYTWTGYLYNNNGDTDGARFKFILGSDFNSCGHFIPETNAVHPTYDTPYKLVFKWDDTSNHLFYSEGAEGSEWRNDLKTFSSESQATRLKVKAVIDLDAMTVTFYKVNDDYTIDKLYIAGAGTEFGETGRGELVLKEDTYSDLYECVVNIIDTEHGFLFPLQQDALLPAMQARTDNYTAHQFEVSGLDYCTAGETSHQFKAETAGVYRVEIRPDYNSLKLYSFDTSYPAQNVELAGTTEGKKATSLMSVKFFEEIAEVDASKIHISPESWTTIDNAPHAIIVKSTDNNTVTFQPNSWDTCLDFGKDYTITFDEGAVTFAPITRAATTPRHNPALSYSFNLASQIIGTGIEECEMTRNIAYNNRIVTAEGTISVYNIAGLLIANGENQIDLTNVAQGIYIVRCGNETLKIVR